MRAAAPVRIAPRAGSSWSYLAACVAGLLAIGLLLRVTSLERTPGIANFVLIFTSVLIEAIPFVLIGVIVSALIEVFVPASLFERLGRLPQPLQLPVAGLAGMAFPVCECGSVPVARRLSAKGLAPGAAITFMLAAPILNPVVIASTIVAYRGRAILWPMVMARSGMGLVIAVAVGWLIGGRGAQNIIRCVPDDPTPPGSFEPGWSRFFTHLSDDFLFMTRFLILGAGVSAALQTLIPQSALGSVASRPVLDLVAMMTLAFLLSLCSESDAFIAASFVQFGPGAQLAFLVFGPMIDTKLSFLYAGALSARVLRQILIAVSALTVVGALWFQVVFG